ncbi:uncharacterized protein TNIN_426651 [Trichonephila inaurata madagascariensis]|uniref:Uncharacterized protein n=1 Tax=Trichonephila inaurata madagascariensis TaxID=2747483 RepID=A0A8X6MI35_9ARAC|nr:uncharacterized protein TNIN_426651 [Trichonephila inaurata madagascariensis]
MPMPRKQALKFWSQLTLLSFNSTILGACLTLQATLYGCSLLYSCSTFFLLLGIFISFYLVLSLRFPLTEWENDSNERFTDKETTAGNQLVPYKMKPFSMTNVQNTQKKHFRNIQRKPKGGVIQGASNQTPSQTSWAKHLIKKRKSCDNSSAGIYRLPPPNFNVCNSKCLDESSKDSKVNFH